MKLLMIRHADPDYERDDLTERGREEARLLGEYLRGVRIDAAYMSPLGRARRTAEAAGLSGETCGWLREFDAVRTGPERTGPGCVWDWLPQDWTAEPDFYSVDAWTRPAFMRDSGAAEKYRAVSGAFDALLDRHGYRREGRFYCVRNPNHDTLAFFCHFGVMCVLLSRLLSVSPMPLWHGFCAAPSSVTTLYTEERRDGIASFRVSEFGAVPHLRRADVEPSFSARFCECFGDPDRHD